MESTDCIDAKLKTLVVKSSRIKIFQSDIHDGSHLMDDFGYDSISLIQLIVDIEQTFSMEFEDEVLILDLLRNYRDLRSFVEKILKNEKD